MTRPACRLREHEGLRRAGGSWVLNSRGGGPCCRISGSKPYPTKDFDRRLGIGPLARRSVGGPSRVATLACHSRSRGVGSRLWFSCRGLEVGRHRCGLLGEHVLEHEHLSMFRLVVESGELQQRKLACPVPLMSACCAELLPALSSTLLPGQHW